MSPPVQRGGTGNIGSPRLKPTGIPGDTDVVPETAIRTEYDNYHTGRGGEGNIRKENQVATDKAIQAVINPENSRHTGPDPAPGETEKAAKPPPSSQPPHQVPNSTQDTTSTSTSPETKHSPTIDASTMSSNPATAAETSAITAASASAIAPATTHMTSSAQGGQAGMKEAKKAEKERKRAEWREQNPPPDHDGLGDRVAYWVKSKFKG
ncbi:MAG: hypothetical protein LQ340_003804 [Diploschistes diacapsis]|nr:MAG: hypothetical protein LQ340_003804 [Diploschistes diacapsis]